MERPNSRMILQRVEPRPDSSGQLTVTMLGSPEFFPGSIKTASSLRIPIFAITTPFGFFFEPMNQNSMADPNEGKKKKKNTRERKEKEAKKYMKRKSFIYFLLIILVYKVNWVVDCRVAEWALRV